MCESGGGGEKISPTRIRTWVDRGGSPGCIISSAVTMSLELTIVSMILGKNFGSHFKKAN